MHTRLPTDFTIDTNFCFPVMFKHENQSSFLGIHGAWCFPCALRADVSETEHGESIENRPQGTCLCFDGHARQKLDLCLPEGKGPSRCWSGFMEVPGEQEARTSSWAGLVESRRGGSVGELSAQPACHFSAQIEDCKACGGCGPCRPITWTPIGSWRGVPRQAAIWSPYLA